MIVEIDNREPKLIKDYFNLNQNNKITYKFSNLEQGDFIIKDDNNNIIYIFERKTINDLLSSVKDTRYVEQSERYSNLDIPTNRIIYIIEGNYDMFQKNSVEFKTIYSCIYSLTFIKGFTLLFTHSIKSSCILLEQFIEKICENKICSSFNCKLIKKNTITKENINEYMLNLVPGIGILTAKEILKHFNGNIYNLIYELKNNDNIDIFKNIYIKSKKISSKIILNIKEYLN